MLSDKAVKRLFQALVEVGILDDFAYVAFSVIAGGALGIWCSFYLCLFLSASFTFTALGLVIGVTAGYHGGKEIPFLCNRWPRELAEFILRDLEGNVLLSPEADLAQALSFRLRNENEEALLDWVRDHRRLLKMIVRSFYKIN